MLFYVKKTNSSSFLNTEFIDLYNEKGFQSTFVLPDNSFFG
jgi:hypothetical protein